MIINGLKKIFSNLYKLVPKKKYTSMNFKRDMDDYKFEVRNYAKK